MSRRSPARKSTADPAQLALLPDMRAHSVEWLSPAELSDHPANVELFSEQRLAEVSDLTLSLTTGFDEQRPIKAVQRADGSFVIIDGHRRRRAALHLKMDSVPVMLATFDNDDERERAEMITANLVRNHNYRTVGLGTSVRLIQMLHPRVVKRGRPGKKSGPPEASITETRREYYARLLGVSVKRYRMAQYVLTHGTKEERHELDYGPRSTTELYLAVHARQEGAEPARALSPVEVARLARDAARVVARLTFAAGDARLSEGTDLEAGVESLFNLARRESRQATAAGTTARGAVQLLRGLLTKPKRGALRRAEGAGSKRPPTTA